MHWMQELYTSAWQLHWMYKLIGTPGSIAEGECLLQPPYQCKCEALKYSYLLMDKPPAAEPEGSRELRTTMPQNLHGTSVCRTIGPEES